jgi:DNA mismatch repair ATPase MutS
MLLFQVGDFYEFFGEDARRASHVSKKSHTKTNTNYKKKQKIQQKPQVFPDD